MTVLAMDTHRVVKRLREVGFTDDQAETFTDVLRETREADLSQLATKTDLAALKADLAALKAELSAVRSDLGNFATKADLAALKAELSAVRSDLGNFATKADLVALKAELSAVRSDLSNFATKADLREEVHRLERRIDGLQGEIVQMENRIVIKLGGLMVVGLTLLGVVVKLV